MNFEKIYALYVENDIIALYKEEKTANDIAADITKAHRKQGSPLRAFILPMSLLCNTSTDD